MFIFLFLFSIFSQSPMYNEKFYEDRQEELNKAAIEFNKAINKNKDDLTKSCNSDPESFFSDLLFLSGSKNYYLKNLYLDIFIKNFDKFDYETKISFSKRLLKKILDTEYYFRRDFSSTFDLGKYYSDRIFYNLAYFLRTISTLSDEKYIDGRLSKLKNQRKFLFSFIPKLANSNIQRNTWISRLKTRIYNINDDFIFENLATLAKIVGDDVRDLILDSLYYVTNKVKSVLYLSLIRDSETIALPKFQVHVLELLELRGDYDILSSFDKIENENKSLLHNFFSYDFFTNKARFYLDNLINNDVSKFRKISTNTIPYLESFKELTIIFTSTTGYVNSNISLKLSRIFSNAKNSRKTILKNINPFLETPSVVIGPRHNNSIAALKYINTFKIGLNKGNIALGTVKGLQTSIGLKYFIDNYSEFILTENEAGNYYFNIFKKAVYNYLVNNKALKMYNLSKLKNDVKISDIKSLNVLPLNLEYFLSHRDSFIEFYINYEVNDLGINMYSRLNLINNTFVLNDNVYYSAFSISEIEKLNELFIKYLESSKSIVTDTEKNITYQYLPNKIQSYPKNNNFLSTSLKSLEKVYEEFPVNVVIKAKESFINNKNFSWTDFSSENYVYNKIVIDRGVISFTKGINFDDKFISTKNVFKNNENGLMESFSVTLQIEGKTQTLYFSIPKEIARIKYLFNQMRNYCSNI